MASDALDTALYTVTGFAERDYVQLVFFGVAFVVMIVFGWLTTLFTFESKGARHSPVFDLIMYGFAGVFFLWFALSIIFMVLIDLISILIKVIAGIFSSLIFTALVSFTFTTAIFRPKLFTSFALRFSMTFKPIVTFGNLPKARITRGAQSFSLMRPIPLTAFTVNNLCHTVIIL